MAILCFECGKTAEHNHHVVPKVLGGTKTIPLCTNCHGLVHDKNMTRHKELQKIGIAKAKKEGKYKGRKRGTYKVDSEYINKLKTQGMSVKEIAKQESVSEMTIYRHLQPKQKG